MHWDEGVLIYQGRRHRFRVRGLGAGGVGMARVRATGEVYDMTSLPQFPGIFGQARRYAARFGCRIPRACDCVCSPIARGWRRSWARMGFLSRCCSPASHKFLAPIRRRLSEKEILTHGGGVWVPKPEHAGANHGSPPTSMRSRRRSGRPIVRRLSDPIARGCSARRPQERRAYGCAPAARPRAGGPPVAAPLGGQVRMVGRSSALRGAR